MTENRSEYPTRQFDRSTAIDALPQFLTLDQVAEYLGIGRTLTYELVRGGRIRATRLGRVYRVSRDVLAELSDAFFSA